MKLWVDDIVKAPEGYAWCRSVGGAKVFIETYEKKDENRNPLTMISVDIDAGCWKDQGGDYINLLKWLEATNRNYQVEIHTKDYQSNCEVIGEMREIIRRNGWDDMDTYLVVDGKKVALTAEQLKALGLAKNRNNSFNRVAEGRTYYYVKGDGEVDSYSEQGDSTDDGLKNASNYFNDEDFAVQVALHQLLYRKLLEFAYDNECEDNQIWGGNGIEHWTIRYNFEDRSFEPDWSAEYKYGSVYFSDREGVRRAINEVIIPFMKEHPDFVW